MIKLKNLLNDKTLMKWSLFCTVTIALLYLLYMVIRNFGAIIGVAVAALSSAGSALTPLFIGIVIAYFLSPAVEFIDLSIMSRAFFKMPEDPIQYERRKKTRFFISVIVTFVLLIATICFIIYGFAVLILDQFVFVGIRYAVSDLMNHFIAYEAAIQEWAASLPQDIVSDTINEATNVVLNWFSNSFTPSSIASVVVGIGGGIINMVIGLVISIYLLKDKSFFLRLCRKTFHLLLPQKTNAIVRETLFEVNMVLSQFIRGALLDGLIVAILTSIALSILGVQFAVFIGIFAGVSNIIPYFGPILGMIPAFLVAVFTDGLTQGILAVIVMIVIQQIDGNIIYPRIVGSKTGLHPLTVLLAITIAGYYTGILGMVIAVPITAIVKIFILKLVYRVESKRH
ncbi:MAG: AI-2E family transporter [Oscillospiraceae bacterium]|nr:AI-2E family transporter [Oscillospiraceae bacterium]